MIATRVNRLRHSVIARSAPPQSVPLAKAREAAADGSDGIAALVPHIAPLTFAASLGFGPRLRALDAQSVRVRPEPEKSAT